MINQKRQVLKPSASHKQSVFKSIILNEIFPIFAKELGRSLEADIVIQNHVGTLLGKSQLNLSGSFVLVDLSLQGAFDGNTIFLLDKNLYDELSGLLKKSASSAVETAESSSGTESPPKTTESETEINSELVRVVAKSFQKALLKVFDKATISIDPKSSSCELTVDLIPFRDKGNFVFIQSDIIQKGKGEWTIFTLLSDTIAEKMITEKGEKHEEDLANFWSTVEGYEEIQARPNILLVDDSTPIRNVIKMMLEKANYHVFDTFDPTNAFKILEEKSIDLILLDVMMPGMDGFTMAKKIRETDKLKDVPIIFCTAKGAKSDVIEGLKVGRIDYIVKPFTKEVLLEKVKKNLVIK